MEYDMPHTKLTRFSVRILRLLQEEAMTAFPAFPEAFGQLNLRESQKLSSPLETDGFFLYYNPELVCRCFLESADRLRCIYLHIHLHCLCLHTVFPGNSFIMKKIHTLPADQMPESRQLWDMACDLSAAWLLTKLLDGCSGFSCTPVFEIDLSRFHEYTLTSGQWMDAASLLPILADSNSLRQLAAECALDTHCSWYGEIDSASEATARASADTTKVSSASVGTSSTSVPHLPERIRLWAACQEKLTNALSSGIGTRGVQSGGNSEKTELQKKESIDYHRFLYRFSVPREETILDMDSFDYIPYHYGMTQLSGPGDCFPALWEPLEYKEVNRLDELAIAIDTSGSCSGRIVRRFLEETWSILRQRENFFSKMRLHLIQCDSMIQEHRIFTSTGEWEAAIPEYRVLGQGNTDFRPVFEYLDRLLQKKEIRRLRGLLYFSDGDGIFPRSRPAYDTAFVFLQKPKEHLKIPDWIICLNLNLPDDF